MNFGIILATHGRVGEALLGAAEMLTGAQDSVRTLSLLPDTDINAFEADFRAAADELAAAYDHVVVLVDIYGGSPFNVVSRAKLSGYDLTAFTGVNLPILIELLFAGDLTPDQVRERVHTANEGALQEITVTLVESDDDDFDL